MWVPAMGRTPLPSTHSHAVGCMGWRRSAEEDPSKRLGSHPGMSWLWGQWDVIICECSLGQQKLLCFRPKWNEVFGYILLPDEANAHGSLQPLTGKRLYP